MALDAQIFGRLVQTQEHGKAPSGEFPGIGRPDSLLTDSGSRQHFSENQMGRTVCNHMMGRNNGAVLQFHTGDLPCCVCVNFACLRMVPHVAAKFPNPAFQGQADFMGTHFGHPGIPGDVANDHGAVVQETEPVTIHAQVAPVGVQNIPGSLGHFQ